MRKYSIMLIAFVLLLCGCGSKTLTPIKYVRWVEDEENGLRVKRAVSDFEFTAQYKPVDYVIAQEEKSNDIPIEFYERRKAELEGYTYINLFIKSVDGKTPVLQNRTTPEGYAQRLNYFLAEASIDFKVLRGRDTLTCTLCHFEQNYGLAAESAIVLVFKPRSNQDPQEDMVLVYNDQVLGTGQVKLKIKGSARDNVPHMKIRG